MTIANCAILCYTRPMQFDAGNLITLGIVFLVLILFRFLDKGNRSIEKIRKHVEKWKEDLSAFVQEKGAAIKDYGIALDVERKSATELMRRIQTLTREELAHKVQALAQIDDRIRDYDASLEELVQMTGRVQENLNRIRDESSFVENVGKRVGEVKDKVENIDKEIGSLSKKLETIEEHFEQENTEALEQAMGEIINNAKSTFADLEASVLTIEQKIEDQQDKLTQTEGQFGKLLSEAVEQAGIRANKAEDAALAKLREQAQERLNLIKTHFEEKIKTVQETVKTKLGEIQEQIKINREEWKTETTAIETRQKTYSADWKKDVQELNTFARQQKEQWNGDIQELNVLAQQQKEQWNRDIQEFTALAQQQAEDLGAAIQKQNEEFGGTIKKQAEDLGAAIQKQNEEFGGTIKKQAEDLSAAIQKQNGKFDEALKKQWEEWTAMSRETGQKVIAAAQETARAKLNEILTLFKGSHEEWKTETAAIKASQKAYSADWKKDVQDLNEFARQQKEQWNKEIQEFAALAQQQAGNLSAAIQKQNEEFGGTIKKQRGEWEILSRNIGQEIITAAQETAKAKLDEMLTLFKDSREEWKTETAALKASQKTYSADWKKDVQDLNEFARQQKEQWNREIQEFATLAQQQADNLGAAIQKQNEELGGTIKKQREEWEILSRNIGQEIIAAAQDRLEEYRLAQEEQFRQLSSVANDATRLETELRRSMQDAINHVNGDFALFGKEIRGTWESSSDEFNSQLQALRDELAGIDRELTSIKEKAFENVSQTLKGFENDFLTDLSRRSVEIDRQLAVWQEALNKRLEEIAEDSEAKRQKAEVRITEDIKKTLAAQGEKLVSELERLKAETAAFEEGIREEMHGADESRKSFSEQLARDLEEVKNAAENELNTKIGQYNLSVSDTLRQGQRDMETQIRSFVSDSKERFDGLEASSEEFRKNAEEWQTQYNTRMRELDDAMEEARRRGREMVAENEERINATKTSLEDIRREITAQAKLFDRTDALKAELNRHVEDMSGNIDRLLQLKNEIAHFENQFIQIKRLEDDVNAKMTRFLSEKRRIEVMESDFNRLLQTSQSVEEKLAQVSNSDDILQTMQVQIRRLEDAIKETEEKYQRVERKNKTLQETNDGIDRNFKALQEDEQSIKKLEDIITALKLDMEAIQSSVETLSSENEKARDAAEKLSALDETVKWLEKRIAEMNVARESLARLATELQNLDKDAQDQLNLTRTLLNREEGKNQGRTAKSTDEGAPPPRDRENIIRLKRQGWSIDEIARSMKISKGEVELILELGPKDIT